VTESEKVLSNCFTIYEMIQSESVR